MTTALLSILGSGVSVGSNIAYAAPGELFFSEYIEGSGNNKALEIANITDTSINLSTYQLKMYFNGKTTAGLTINLEGNLKPGDVHVIAHGKASSDIIKVADQTQSSGWFNGDDAITLVKSDTVIDSIGQIGFDPGSQWGQDLQSTKDNTLRRDLNLDNGDTDPYNAFNPVSEWSGYANNTFENLGKIDSVTPPTEFSCNEPATLIHTVQGTGSSTPLSGDRDRSRRYCGW